jgi:hypothetical protein
MLNQLNALGEAAAIALLNGEDLRPDNPRLARRGFFQDAWDWIKSNDATCTVAAGTALPFYLKYAGIFKELHRVSWPQGKPSHDQQFFVFPLHGASISRDVTIFYESRRPPGFKDTYGSVFGRNVYIRYDDAPKGSDPNFTAFTRLLLHELTHSVQYRDRNWSLVRFGTDYLFKYCKAGWSYSKNEMEKEADNKAARLEPLLTDKNGTPFFKAWRTRSSVSNALGFPTQTSYKNISTSPVLRELEFQKGIMQTDHRGCHRIFTGGDIDARKASQCTMRSCNRPRSPPTNWQGPPPCDHAKISAANARCSQAKAKWRTIMNAKSFTC